MSGAVLCEAHGPVRLVTLNRPAKMRSLDFPGSGRARPRPGRDADRPIFAVAGLSAQVRAKQWNMA